MVPYWGTRRINSTRTKNLQKRPLKSQKDGGERGRTDRARLTLTDKEEYPNREGEDMVILIWCQRSLKNPIAVRTWARERELIAYFEDALI